MKKRLISTIVVVLFGMSFFMSSSFASNNEKTAKEYTYPIMYLASDDEDPAHG